MGVIAVSTGWEGIAQQLETGDGNYIDSDMGLGKQELDSEYN
jgi:hypothetical protein